MELLYFRKDAVMADQDGIQVNGGAGNEEIDIIALERFRGNAGVFPVDRFQFPENLCTGAGKRGDLECFFDGSDGLEKIFAVFFRPP